MGPFVLAWLTGETIIIYRTAKTYKAPPGPGQLLLSSGLFALLSLIAESEKGRTPATLFAWGINLAAFMNLYPSTANKAGQTLAKALGQVVAPTTSQKWPPPIASNTTVIPNGTTADSATSSNSSGSGSNPLNGMPYTPNLMQ